MAITLEQLRDIINIEFGEPYLVENGVYAIIHQTSNGKELEISIGRRDCRINEFGEVIGAGTLLGMPDDILVFNQP